MKLLHRSGDTSAKQSLYYASDLHGSRVCWRKFVNAGGFYSVDALVMGGDLCGKGLVPIVNDGNGFSATVGGEERHVATETELAELEDGIRRGGLYPWRTTSEEVARMRRDQSLLDKTLEQAMLDELQEWMAFADDRLGPGGPPIYMMAGNDDPWSVDSVVASGEHVMHCDEQVVRVGEHEMVSFGWANRTPWNTPRELDESELYRRLRALADQLENPKTAILNLHVPPYDSGLDIAPELDETFTPVVKGGQPHEIPVGSTAVRQIIEEVQPALSLHGHIHESRGITTIGKTVAINPGSNYGSGRIDGCVVVFDGPRVKAKRLVSG
jgi:Icc-related predicted phosphoesterase